MNIKVEVRFKVTLSIYTAVFKLIPLHVEQIKPLMRTLSVCLSLLVAKQNAHI